MKFEEFGLAETILRAVSREGYEEATPIQIQAIPPVMKGRDLMGCAQTGTGKTAAFALPTLHRLAQKLAADGGAPAARDVARGPESHPAAARRPDPRGFRNDRGPFRPGHDRRAPASPARKIRALILSPTRELAAQIGESFRAYGSFTGLRHTVVFGGVSQVPQVRDLRFGVDILIATPGRLLDLMEQGYIDLSGVEILILDEADQMLDMGFIQPLRRIVSQVPRRRQTLMFSATMPPEIRQLANEWLREPVRIEVAPVATPAEKVEQFVYFVDPKQKPRLLAQYLRTSAQTRTLVFARTKHGADRITKHLARSGIRAEAIHGNKSQGARQRVLAQFKSKQPPVLVATDIAARGLDIDAISHVINYDLPEVPETYVHRIGRTGRAGATGVAIAFCSREERQTLRQIERLMRRSIRVEVTRLEATLDDAEIDAAPPAEERFEQRRSNFEGPSRHETRRFDKPRAARPQGPGRGHSGHGGHSGNGGSRPNHFGKRRDRARST